MSRSDRIPLQVWILTLAAFAIGTAEFVIAGILTDVADSLNITNGQAGNMITAYALAIVVGGPFLPLWLARYEKRKVLLGLMALFIVGNLISAFSSSYYVLFSQPGIFGLNPGSFLWHWSHSTAFTALGKMPSKQRGYLGFHKKLLRRKRMVEAIFCQSCQCVSTTLIT
ncbi:Inner membrane transport protein YdhP [invertebrate metagenome]|uniref:Inner membrane transport protein YdhP n=1 Tax=invertebrate metagenome TaxID=1711999 RepID=A0A2H9T7K0_9ZZZZ